jgi:hypothetical protein
LIPGRKRTIAIVQSNYLPWRGYFDMIRSVDEFILLDVVQYTRRDWRNRNIIKTPQGPLWITIPVEVKGKYLQPIDETRISDRGWAEGHARTIELNYRRAAGFEQIAPWLFKLLQDAAREELLTKVNEGVIRATCELLNIHVAIRRCTDLLGRDELIAMEPTARLLALCQAAGAKRYRSGPAARSYLDEQRFAAAGIDVAWMDYSGYPEYPQLWGAFEPRVSVIDLLLNVGTRAATLLGRPQGEAVNQDTAPK